MPGFGSPLPPIIPNREVKVTIFKYLPECQEQAVLFDKTHEYIGIGEESRHFNTVYIPEVGWQLKSKQFDPSDVWEIEGAQEGVQTIAGGKIIVAPGIEEKSVNRQPDGPGIGVLAGYADSSPMFTPMLPTGTTWDIIVVPGPEIPDAADDAVPITLIARTSGLHLPTETISLRISVPAAGVDTLGALAVFMFTGPAGSSRALTGIGQYALKLYGDGRAKLYERGKVPGTTDLVWLRRWTFRWAEDLNSIGGSTQWITILSNAFDDGAGNWFGTKIAFLCNAVADGGSTLINSVLAASIGALRNSAGSGFPVYRVPRLTKEPAIPTPARFGIRQGYRGFVQIARHTYPTTGYVIDDGFALDFFPTDREPMKLEWYGNFPPATAIDLRLFDAENDVELTGTLITTDQYGGVKSFPTPAGVRQYRVQFDFTSNGERTATLKSYRVFRPQITETPDVEPQEITVRREGGALPETAITDVSIQGPTYETNDDSACFHVYDLTDRYPVMVEVAEVPVLIETTYNSDGDRAPLFYGYSQSPEIDRNEAPVNLDGSIGGYPTEDWRSTRMVLTGFWRRLSEGFSPKRFTWLDPVTSSPMKVTDILVQLLISGKVPAEMIDVPDIPVRLSGFEEDELVVQPGDAIIDVAAGLARDYFGGYFIFDPSAGTLGMVRLMLPPGLPKYPLAKFFTGHPGDGLVSHSSLAWGSSMNGPQTIQHSYVLAGSWGEGWEPPGGNCVVVYGGGSGNSDTGETSGAQLTQVLVNVESYNFLGLDTGHAKYPRPSATNPSFLGRYKPIKVYDPTLSDQLSVDWVCRQVYLSSCFARRIFRFVSPLLLVTDIRDSLQTKPRPLRTGDCVVLINQKEDSTDTYSTIVRKCDPFVDSFGNQWGYMECVSSKVIDDLGWFNWTDNRLANYLRAAKRAMSISAGATAGSAGRTQAQRGTMPGMAAWMALPHVTGEPIQDIDPDSPTFGQLLWSMDFSPME